MDGENNQIGFSHLPVLYQEIIDALQPTSGGTYVDCTVGAGGHAKGILQASSPDGKLLGFDLDLHALEIARKNLKEFGNRVFLVHASYVTLHANVEQLGWHEVNGVLLDLGASSMQFDIPERGFSFSKDAFLDMRFNQDQEQTAADLINNLSEQELIKILFDYGEEKNARKIAREIIRSRPINRTKELSEIIIRAIGPSMLKKKRRYRRHDIHPATRTFQALRIAVNDELESLTKVLPQAIEVLKPGGRLAVISFHSLEDRIVKQFFRRESRDCICPPEQPICTCEHKATIVEINRKPIQPAEDEILHNPRSRSAKLRIVEKLF